MEPETVRTGAGKCLEILTDYCTQLRLFVVGFFCLFSRASFASRRKEFLRGKNRIHRVTLLALMIAMDVVLSPLMRIEGMAPMSSVMNIIAGVLLGPLYGTLMALVCGLIRMTFLGIPPLALTGAVLARFCWFILSMGTKIRLVDARGNFWDRHHWLVIVLSCNGLVYWQ